jgi:predicted GNAT family N-acyltransferase
LDSIYQALCQLDNEYPQFYRWYYDKVAKDIFKGEREVLFTISSDKFISGIVILKKSFSENKLCTIRVPEPFQKNGLGKSLIIKAMEILNDEKPLVSVSFEKEREFKKLFNYFGFLKTQELRGKYLSRASEIVYNGVLF